MYVDQVFPARRAEMTSSATVDDCDMTLVASVRQMKTLDAHSVCALACTSI